MCYKTETNMKMPEKTVLGLGRMGRGKDQMDSFMMTPFMMHLRGSRGIVFKV